MKNEKWLELPNEEQANIAKKDGYEIKKINGVWFFNKNKTAVNSTTGTIDPGIKLVENIIRKLLREAKQWLEVPQGEYNNKKNDPKFETKEENGKYYIKEKEDPNTNTGGGAAPVSALPKWVDTHKCLKGAQPIGQGDNIIIAYNDKGVDRKLSLSSNGTAVDSQDQGFTGTWKCTSDTSLVIETSKTTSSSSVGGSGSGGNLNSGGGGGCSESMFPPCVTNLQKQENPCSFKGFALTNDKVEYQVIYYPQKAKGPDGMEQFSCWIYNNGWKSGYYSCGVTGPIVTTDFGQLTGINKGAYKVISSKDRGTIIAKLKSIPDFITTNEEGTQIIDIDEPKLEQAIYEIQNLVKEGYRGLSIRYFIKFLQQSETLLETELNQAKSTITEGLKKIDDIIKNNEKTNFDPEYVVDLDPSARLLGQNKYDIFNYPIPALNETFKVYRSKSWAGRTKTTQMTGAYAEKVKKEGLNEQVCEESLKAYMISINKGQMVGASTTGASSNDYDPDTAKETIKACASAGLYDRGLFRGNKKYDNAINYLNNLPVEKGDFD